MAVNLPANVVFVLQSEEGEGKVRVPSKGFIEVSLLCAVAARVDFIVFPAGPVQAS